LEILRLADINGVNVYVVGITVLCFHCVAPLRAYKFKEEKIISPPNIQVIYWQKHCALCSGWCLI
jgi:hypothetical protein